MANAHMQQEMAAALWSMAADNGDNQAAIAEAGAIPSLIALVRGRIRRVHTDAAGALWSLGALPSNQQLIAAKGGIPPLVQLLIQGESSAQESAAGALHSLASHVANRGLITEAGGVPALVQLFEKGTATAKAQAAGALSAMVVQNGDIQSAVAKALVRTLSSDDPSMRSAQEHATHLIRHLTTDPESRSALARAGAVPHLVRQLVYIYASPPRALAPPRAARRPSPRRRVAPSPRRPVAASPRRPQPFARCPSPHVPPSPRPLCLPSDA